MSNAIKCKRSQFGQFGLGGLKYSRAVFKSSQKLSWQRISLVANTSSHTRPAADNKSHGKI